MEQLSSLSPGRGGLLYSVYKGSTEWDVERDLHWKWGIKRMRANFLAVWVLGKFQPKKISCFWEIYDIFKNATFLHNKVEKILLGLDNFWLVYCTINAVIRTPVLFIRKVTKKRVEQFLPEFNDWQLFISSVFLEFKLHNKLIRRNVCLGTELWWIEYW